MIRLTAFDFVMIVVCVAFRRCTCKILVFVRVYVAIMCEDTFTFVIHIATSKQFRS